VTVTSSGGCHPKPTRACTVSLNASASDPDGDNLRYGWDGCAQGNAPLALCTINAPGTFTATVLVDDGNGGLARASGVAEGTNLPPNIHMAHLLGPYSSNFFITTIGQQPDDPEDDDDPNTLCSRAKLVVSGPCRAVLFECGGVSDGFDIDVFTLQGPGTCVIEARVPDIWGAVGVDRMVFNVLP
jgi:hypothetical protein